MNKKKTIMIISLIIGLLLLTLGVTFSIFNLSKIGEKNSKLIVGDIYMHYTENSNFINLENQMPSSSYDESSYFEFIIDGKNTTKDKDIWYEIILNHGSVPSGKQKSNRIKDNLLKFRLVEIKNNKETIVLDNKTYKDLTNKRIWVNTIDKNTTSDVTITYRLYMWISKSTLICSGDIQDNCDYYLNGTNPSWSDVYASIKVDVTGDFEKKYIETNASCFNVNEIDNNGVTELEISSYMPSCGTDVVIPSEINGLKVTSIASCKTMVESNELIVSPNDLNYYANKKYNLKKTGYQSCAFKDVGLTSIVIPNSVTTIGEESFRDNQLTNIVIPDSVTEIGCAAFSDNQLTNVIIPDSVTEIGDYAFSGNQLTSVIIPNSVTEIGYGVFSYNKLTNIVIPDTVIKIESAAFNNNKLSDNQAFIYERLDSNNDGVAEINTKKIVSYGGSNKEVIIPNGVTEIGDYAFSNNQLTSIEISDSVITIGNDAFRGNKLTSVEIPNNVTTIGDSAFYDNKLTNITIPDSVTNIGWDTFSNNQLTSVTIGSGIKYIGFAAFYKVDYSNPNLKSIKINKSCSDIKNIPASSSDSRKFYPWLNNENEVTIYGLNGEVCDSY